MISRNSWGQITVSMLNHYCRSSKWKEIPVAVREELGVKIEKDGEFWMEFSDFTHNYTYVEVCHVASPFVVCNSDVQTWRTSQMHGKWIKGSTAGGPRKSTFLGNVYIPIHIPKIIH